MARASLTLIVINSGSLYSDPMKTVKSLEAEDDFYIENVILFPGVDFQSVKIKTDWKLFLFSNEFVSPQLREALPIYMNYTRYDYYSMFRTNYQKEFKSTEAKISISPRMFRKYVNLRENSFVPSMISNLSGTNILDGFIIGVD